MQIRSTFVEPCAKVGGGTPYLYFPGRLGGGNLPAVFFISIFQSILFCSGVASPFDYVANVAIYFYSANYFLYYFPYYVFFFRNRLSGMFWACFFANYFFSFFISSNLSPPYYIRACVLYAIMENETARSERTDQPPATRPQRIRPPGIFHAAAHPSGRGRGE